MENLTPAAMMECLAEVTKMPKDRVRVEKLVLYAAFLDGRGETQARARNFYCSRDSMFEKPGQNPLLFNLKLGSWKSILWPTLKEFRLSGPFGDVGPAFSPECLQELGEALPNLETLELLSLPVEFDATWFPNLRHLSFTVGQVSPKLDLLKKVRVGSEKLISLSLPGASVESVIAFLVSSPNLQMLDLGRTCQIAQKNAVTSLKFLKHLKRIVAPAQVLQVLELDFASLESLQVYNCQEVTDFSFLKDPAPTTVVYLHRVSRAAQNLPESSLRQIEYISDFARTPEGFVPIKMEELGYGYGGYPLKDHSKESTGQLDKSTPCKQCLILIDPKMIDDHNLVCIKRERSCEMCFQSFPTRKQVDEHKKTCEMNRSFCSYCGEMILNSQMSAHLHEHWNRTSDVTRPRDCPNTVIGGCTFSSDSLETARRTRHIERCLGVPVICPFCRESLSCRAKPHDCLATPKMVLCGLPNKFRAEGKVTYEQVEGGFKCGDCEEINAVTSESSWTETTHCRKCGAYNGLMCQLKQRK
jgi:hypothetical protein